MCGSRYWNMEYTTRGEVVVVYVDGTRLCLWTGATSGPIVHPPDDRPMYMSMEPRWNDWQVETEELGEKPVPVIRCAALVRHGLARVRISGPRAVRDRATNDRSHGTGNCVLLGLCVIGLGDNPKSSHKTVVPMLLLPPTVSRGLSWNWTGGSTVITQRPLWLYGLAGLRSSSWSLRRWYRGFQSHLRHGRLSSSVHHRLFHLWRYCRRCNSLSHWEGVVK
jgi:hypothetical protein